MLRYGSCVVLAQPRSKAQTSTQLAGRARKNALEVSQGLLLRWIVRLSRTKDFEHRRVRDLVADNPLDTDLRVRVQWSELCCESNKLYHMAHCINILTHVTY